MWNDINEKVVQFSKFSKIVTPLTKIRLKKVCVRACVPLVVVCVCARACVSATIGANINKLMCLRTIRVNLSNYLTLTSILG